MLKTLIIEGQRRTDAQKAWTVDRSKYLTASEADNCIRQLWYAKHTPDQGAEQGWGFAWRGYMVEEYVVRMLRARNSVELLLAGDDQRSFADEARRLSATPDGLFRVADGPWQGLEVKSIDPRANKSKLPKPGHVTQFRIAMRILNDSLEASFKIDSGVLMYVDASNLDDILEFTVEPADDAMMDAYAEKAAKLFKTRKPDVLDREGARFGGCDLCPFKAVCAPTVTVAERKVGYANTSLDKAVQTYADVQDQIAGLTAQKDDLKVTITNELTKRKTNSLLVKGISVKLTPVAGRETLDKKAVQAAGIDLSPYMKAGAPSTRLEIRR